MIKKIIKIIQPKESKNKGKKKGALCDYVATGEQDISVMI